MSPAKSADMASHSTTFPGEPAAVRDHTGPTLSAAHSGASAFTGPEQTLQERIAEFGHQASERLGDAAAYFREHDFTDVRADVNEFVKTHPTQALVGAALLGFVAAALVRRL
jgi:hypothetical protein